MALARRHADLELVCADAMQVYRGMDIGTAKPTAADQRAVAHHGIDIVDPHEAFTVAQYRAVADDAVASIAGRGRRAVLVGGTGLYVRAVIDHLEPPGSGRTSGAGRQIATPLACTRGCATWILSPPAG